MKKIRRQPPVKGGRAHIAPCVLHAIDEEIRRIAHAHNVSRSWVISTVLADAFRIKEQPTFYQTTTKLRRIK